MFLCFTGARVAVSVAWLRGTLAFPAHHVTDPDGGKKLQGRWWDIRGTQINVPAVRAL